MSETIPVGTCATCRHCSGNLTMNCYHPRHQDRDGFRYPYITDPATGRILGEDDDALSQVGCAWHKPKEGE